MSVEARSLQDAIEIGPLEVVPSQHIARLKGRAMMLSIRELQLLIELARQPDRIMEREELVRRAWGREMRAGDRSVDVYVRRLRVKLEQALPGWRFIHTHFGFGYRLAPERSAPPEAEATQENRRARGRRNAVQRSAAAGGAFTDL
jgi:DNA-binding response OmpR family regulator